ncbi:MAG: DnaB-like helicase C-terminal domain-containing protein [Bacteroidales bacterium]
MTTINQRISSGIIIKNQEISFEKGKISIISSKKGIGKTTLMLEIAKFMSIKKQGFSIFSMKEKPKELYGLYLESEKRKAPEKSDIEIKAEFNQFIHKNISYKPNYYCDCCNSNASNIFDYIIQTHNRNKTEIFFIDYFQYIQEIQKDGFEDIKELIKELDVAVVVLFLQNKESNEILHLNDEDPFAKILTANNYQINTLISLYGEDEVYMMISQDGNEIGRRYLYQ